MTSTEIERWSPIKAWLYNLFYRSPKSNRAVIDLIGLGTEDRFLDVGCGPGAALEHAAATGASIAGIDPSPSMAARAAKRVPAAHVEVASAEEIPFPDDSFTVVINIASFHHWADREAGLREVLRVLAPGGRLYITEGVLRQGKEGHGLGTVDTELLVAKLRELGFSETGIEQIKTGWRHEYFVISASAPRD